MWKYIHTEGENEKKHIYVISRDIGRKRGKISLRFSANEGK